MKQVLFCLALLLVLGTVGAQAQEEYQKEFEAVRPSAYNLGPDDVLRVFVWGDDQLTHDVVVRPDGNISLPLIGEVSVGGRTVDDVRKEVDKRYKQYVTDAPVSIMLLEVNFPKVYIIGKVNRPGMYLMPHPMTMTQALALAGGFNPFAADRSVLLIRGIGDEQIYFEYDYEDVDDGRDLPENNVLLKPNDTIVVP